MAVTNNPPTGEVTIVGETALQGAPLTATAALQDADGLGAISYTWQRDDGAGGWSMIAGATSATYSPIQADVGHLLRAMASYTDQLGTAEQVLSDATPPIGNVNDPPTGSLTIPGVARQGVALTVSSTLADLDGLGTFAYRWQRNEGVAGWRDITGAAGAAFIPTQADVGHGLRVVVTYTDQQGTEESVVSSSTPPVANVNDAPTGSITIIGTAAEAQTLNLADTLDDADGMGDESYMWQRSNGRGGWTTIPYSNGPSYTPSQADVGFTLRAVVSYTDGYGTGESVVSTPTAVIANTNDPPTGSVTIAGVPIQNQPLVASNTLADTDGLGIIAYTWQRYDGTGTWSTIPGSTGSRYLPVQADVGRVLRAVASYTDGYGTPERVASDATDFVANVNDPATGSIVITGTPAQYQRLTAAISVSDPDGVGPWVPQWQRLDALAGWLDIAGANATSYTLEQGDAGFQLRVLVSFTDLQGSDENIASAPTAMVANVEDTPTGSVTLRGTALQGATLSATNTLDDLDGMTDVSYAWQRADGNGGWAPISGANSDSYVPTQADAGQALRVVASYTDGFGTFEAVASTPTVPVVALSDIPPNWATAAPLFDAAWYLSQYPDVAAAGINPFLHYMNSGWREGRDPSALFHTAYYLNQNPDVAAAGINPLLHYANGGWSDGRDPSAAFSLSRYLAAYPDIRAMGTDPLQYQMATGQAEGRSTFSATPHATGPLDPLVDQAFYYAAHPEVAIAGIDASVSYHSVGWQAGWSPDAWFDTGYYLSHNPDVRAAGVDPLAHFEGSGWREGRDPSAMFSLQRYLDAYADVRMAGIDPLVHYVGSGRTEGRQAFAVGAPASAPRDPLVDTAFYLAQRPNLPSGTDASADYHANGWQTGASPDPWFDTGFYLAQNPDVRAAGIDPLLHYETSGWSEGRLPSLLFDARAYLSANPDVAAAGIEPLTHYISSGRVEGRPATLPGGALPADPLVDAAYYDRQLGATLIPPGLAGQQQAAWSYDTSGWQRGLNPDAWFDTNYYLSHNPDVAAAHIDPLLHYETSGWREGRDPSAVFSTTKYLFANQDVAGASINPLLHFVAFGQMEGRMAIPV